MMQAIKNIFQLGKKEILSLCRDWLLMALILYSFTAAIIVASNASTDFADAAIAVACRHRPHDGRGQIHVRRRLPRQS